MGKFADDIKSENNRPLSRWDKLTTQLSKEDLADLKDVLLDENVTTTSIVRVLRSRNIYVDRQTVTRWRKGER
jgi:hypothetical protein